MEITLSKHNVPQDHKLLSKFFLFLHLEEDFNYINLACYQNMENGDKFSVENTSGIINWNASFTNFIICCTGNQFVNIITKREIFVDIANLQMRRNRRVRYYFDVKQSQNLPLFILLKLFRQRHCWKYMLYIHVEFRCRRNRINKLVRCFR